MHSGIGLQLHRMGECVSEWQCALWRFDSWRSLVSACGSKQITQCALSTLNKMAILKFFFRRVQVVSHKPHSNETVSDLTYLIV